MRSRQEVGKKALGKNRERSAFLLLGIAGPAVPGILSKSQNIAKTCEQPIPSHNVGNDPQRAL